MRPEAGDQSESELLDSIDERIIAILDDLHRRNDPVPDDLRERVRFSLETPTEPGARLASISRSHESLAVRESELGRGDPASITFDCEAITVLLTPRPSGAGEIRLDGWIGPSGDYEVELRNRQGTLLTSTDETGRFVFEGLPGDELLQLVIRSKESPRQPGLPQAMITPVVRL